MSVLMEVLMYGWIDECVGGGVDGWMSVLMEGLMYGWIDECMDGGVDVWMDEGVY